MNVVYVRQTGIHKKAPVANTTEAWYLNLAMSYFIRRIRVTHPFGAAFGSCGVV